MIHTFTLDENYFVLDSASGAVHVIDKPVYEILTEMPGAPPDLVIKRMEGRFAADVIKECLAEIRELIQSGLLFTKDEYEGVSASSVGTPVIKALCLHLAHDCNLDCAYCFGKGGSFGNERTLMPFETAKAAIDFLLKHSGNRENLEVDFFGGEPLLNFDTLKQTIEYGKKAEGKKKIHFTLTTNGLLLDNKKIDFINKHIDNIVLSLDGRAHVNDKARKLKNGVGSYDKVLPKISELVKSRGVKDYYVRGTYTAFNHSDFADDVLHLADLGFKNISVEPVVSNDETALKVEHLPAIFKEYERLTRLLLKRASCAADINFFHFNIDLSGGPCVYKRLKGCGAGTEYLAVTPEGELYPCHQFAGNAEYLLGGVKSGITNLSAVARFKKTDIYSKEKCRICPVRFFCGGGCHANAVSINGDISQPYHIGCEILKKRTECALAYNVLKDNNKNKEGFSRF